MSDEYIKKLFANGHDILESARLRMLPLEPGPGLTVLQEGGWDTKTDGDALYASHMDDATQTYAFLSARKFDASPLQILCMIRDFDASKLAGDLQEFHILESTDAEELVQYVSTLPWPFEPRWLRVRMRYGVVRETGALLVHSVSEPHAEPPSGATRGTVYYAYYHIFPGDTADTAVLYRIINVDMHVPLPNFVVRKALASRYRSDMDSMEVMLAAWDASPLRARLEGKSCYRSIEKAALLAAAARRPSDMPEDGAAGVGAGEGYGPDQDAP